MRDELDRIVDDAVKHYGEVDPAPDLAERILRRAQLESRPQPRRWKLALAIALPLAAAAVLAFVLAAWMKLPPAPMAVATAPAVPELHAVRVAAHLTAEAVHTRPRKLKVRAARPLSAPYSKQELALAAFVEQHPKEAAAIAKSQSQPLKPISEQPITISHLEIAPLTITALNQEK